MARPALRESGQQRPGLVASAAPGRRRLAPVVLVTVAAPAHAAESLSFEDHVWMAWAVVAAWAVVWSVKSIKEALL